MSSATLNHALSWAQRGFRVFPVQPGKKLPRLGLDWTKSATVDAAQIKSWWGEGTWNIGVLCDDMIVVDVDVKNDQMGATSLIGLIGEGLPESTLTVSTPSGGMHKYYRSPVSTKNRHNLMPGIDIKSEHGYVLAPGSVIDGKEYTLLTDAPLADAPSEFVARIGAPPRQSHTETNPVVGLDHGTAVSSARQYLVGEAPAIQGSGGDAHTLNVANRVIDYGISEALAIELMLEGWNERCDPPWPAEELAVKVANAWQYRQLPPGTASPEHHFAGIDPADFAPPVEPHTIPTEGLAGLLVPRSFHLEHDIPKRDFIVKRLLMRKYITALVAPGAAGKSTFQLQIAAHVAVGKSFAGFDLAEPGVPLRVIVINLEDDRMEMERRMLAICKAHGLNPHDVSKNVVLLPGSEYFFKVADGDRKFVVREGDLRLLTQTCLREGISAVFIDPLIETHDRDMNDNTGVKSVMALYRSFAQQANVAIMLAHHTSKGALSRMKAGDVDASMGAAAVTNSSRIAFTMFNASDADIQKYGIPPKQAAFYVRLDDAKQNMAIKAAEPVWMRRQSVDLMSGDSIGVLVVEDMDKKIDAVKAQKARVIRDHLEANNIVAITALQALTPLRTTDTIFDKEIQGNEVTARKALEKLFAKPFFFEDGRALRCVAESTDKKTAAKLILE